MPQEFGLADSGQFGLFVVSRLAGRHQIHVTLTTSAYGGTMATVLLPLALVVAEEGASLAAASTAYAGTAAPHGGPGPARPLGDPGAEGGWVHGAVGMADAFTRRTARLPVGTQPTHDRGRCTRSGPEWVRKQRAAPGRRRPVALGRRRRSGQHQRPGRPAGAAGWSHPGGACQ